MDYIKKYISTFQKKYPNSFSHLEEDQLGYLVSDHTLDISRKYFSVIEKFISDFFYLSRDQRYEEAVKDATADFVDSPLKNSSVLMAYDFHMTDKGPKLIEVNTNASFYLIGDLLYQSFGEPDHLDPLLNSFKKELSFHDTKLGLAVIIDENPKKQKNYLEFLMYQELLQKIFSKVVIADYTDLQKDGTLHGQSIDFVYNRSTDFYFKDSPVLKSLYQKGVFIFSPHPKEYALLADKSRLIELSHESYQYSEINLEIIPKTISMQSLSAQELWANKKHYFFKPKNLFGSKSTYRGKSISKGQFERMYEADSLAQEYIPPQKIHTSEDEELKADLRVFAYEDSVQMMMGRLYKGQTTNMSSKKGGVCRVRIVPNDSEVAS